MSSNCTAGTRQMERECCANGKPSRPSANGRFLGVQQRFSTEKLYHLRVAFGRIAGEKWSSRPGSFSPALTAISPYHMGRSPFEKAPASASRWQATQGKTRQPMPWLKRNNRASRLKRRTCQNDTLQPNSAQDSWNGAAVAASPRDLGLQYNLTPVPVVAPPQSAYPGQLDPPPSGSRAAGQASAQTVLPTWQLTKSLIPQYSHIRLSDTECITRAPSG